MAETNQIYDTIIIGSGPAGLTAAIYNIRSALKTVVIAGNQPGGQLTITTLVGNYPGFVSGIGGTKLMMDMQVQFRNLGGEIRNGEVRKILNSKSLNSNNFEVELEDGTKLQTRAVIVATGAGARWLNIPKEKELIGRGVSGCATCDGMFFKDKTVAIVGGGDVACTEADFLTKFATKVYLIHRRDQLRAQVPQKKLVENNPKIEFIWETVVTEIGGEEKLTSVKMKNVKTGGEKILPLDGLFVAIGRIPATDFVKGVAELKETGQIVVGKYPEFLSMSSTPGIFAAGDCVDDVYRQAIIAAGDGARAGLDAERWLRTGN